MGSYTRALWGSGKGFFKGFYKGFFSSLGFRGSYKWGHKPPNMGHNYSYRAYNPICNYP